VLQTKTRCVPLETVLSRAIPSQSWKDVSGSASSKAAELGDRLRFSLPVMSKSRTPIYPSESKKLLRYSQKLKGAKMNENLIVEVVAAINVPPSSLGPRSSLAPASFRDEVCKPLSQRGFLLPSGVVIPSNEVVGSSLPLSQYVGEKMLVPCQGLWSLQYLGALLCCRLPQRWVNLRGELILKGSVIYVFKHWGSPTKEM